MPIESKKKQDSKDLAQRFLNVLWCGTLVANTNYKQEIEHVTYITASQKVGSLNTIANLLQHINYYIVGLNTVFGGGPLDIKDTNSFKFPEITSEKQWEKIKINFFENVQTFAAYVNQLSNTTLNSIFVKNKYSTYKNNIELMIEHCYYHLGQVVIIKKLLSSS